MQHRVSRIAAASCRTLHALLARLPVVMCCSLRAGPPLNPFRKTRTHTAHPSGGHYTADVLQPDGVTWLRFNDAVVDVVPEAAVLGERPYLLFYQRSRS